MAKNASDNGAVSKVSDAATRSDNVRLATVTVLRNQM